jgi:DMSO/TMAO reductase YedYZ molybdopterin-dependent catalytic subunit
VKIDRRKFKKGKKIMSSLHVVNMMGDKPPDNSDESWILTIDGLVEKPLEFSWSVLMEFPSVEREAPLF